MLENYTGYFMGRTLAQISGRLGGARSVFVKLQGVKNELVYPPFGGQVQNPFKGVAKIFAGDLMEYRLDDKGENPKIYLLKTYKVQTMSTTTTVHIYRDDYSHIPFVGDVLMKAPATIVGTGKAYTVTAVEQSTNDGHNTWKLTFNKGIDSCFDGDVLVEAESVGESSKMVVKAINAVAANDYDFLVAPVATVGSSEDADFNNARYYLTPALGGLMYISKMSPMPKCVLDLNKCNIKGWFQVQI